MKFTKERIVYAAVLGVGLLALIADRALLAPSGASAALPGASPAEPSKPAAIKPDVVTVAAAPRGPGLAARLRADDEMWLQNVRDGFRASESWIAPPQVKTAAESVPDEIKIFEQAHKLTAVHGSNSENPRIIVAGKILQLGAEIDGWKLREVTATSAAFEKDGMRAVLELNVKRLPGNFRPPQGEPGEQGSSGAEQSPAGPGPGNA